MTSLKNVCDGGKGSIIVSHSRVIHVTLAYQKQTKYSDAKNAVK